MIGFMQKAHFGMVGLGTMGRNLLLNVAEKGFSSVGFDKDAKKRGLLDRLGAGLPVGSATDIASLIASIDKPRRIMLLVPSGQVVDSVIVELMPNLEPGDILIDGGNSHFPDTARREKSLKEEGIAFLGVGISGGEQGARRGPSIMVGGDPAVYRGVRPIFEAVSAKVNGEPCAAHVGIGPAGHFVKMVHNGIEYAMMQLIAEAYDLLKRGLAKNNAEIAEIFAEWNRGRLNSFLIELTSIVLRKRDPETENSLVDMILDAAGQKGTGMWTSQAAMDLGVPIPSIDSAVTMRQISAQKKFREKLAGHFSPIGNWPNDNWELEDRCIERALHSAFLSAYAQGFSMLRAASVEMGFELDLVEIAKIWRGGCIIRAAMLEDIRTAHSEEPGLENLIASPRFQEAMSVGREDLRRVVVAAASAGIPAMGFAATLNYLTAFTTERLPANLIQAQRDYFGAHTYRRTDREGTFHTDDWDG